MAINELTYITYNSEKVKLGKRELETLREESVYRLPNSSQISVYASIHKTVLIEDTVLIEGNVKLGKGVSIGRGSTVKCGTTIGEHTVIKEEVNIGRYCTIGSFCQIDKKCEIKANANIDDTTAIGSESKIHEGVVIGRLVTLGKKSDIGLGSYISNEIYAPKGIDITGQSFIPYRARFKDRVTIHGHVFPCVQIFDKWMMHPVGIGKVRLGCFTGSYRQLKNRTLEDWYSKTYTPEEIQAVMSTIDYFESIEHLIFTQ